MAKPLSAYSLDDLKKLAANFRRLGVNVGPHFTLADVMREIDRQEHGEFTIDGLMELISKRAVADPKRLISYKEIYLAVNGSPPEKGFIGQHWSKPITDKLEQLSEYCHLNGWPLVSILVVADAIHPDGTRQLGPVAKRVFYDDWHERYDIKAANAGSWCAQMTERAMEFVRANKGDLAA